MLVDATHLIREAIGVEDLSTLALNKLRGGECRQGTLGAGCNLYARKPDVIEPVWPNLINYSHNLLQSTHHNSSLP